MPAPSARKRRDSRQELLGSLRLTTRQRLVGLPQPVCVVRLIGRWERIRCDRGEQLESRLTHLRLRLSDQQRDLVRTCSANRAEDLGGPRPHSLVGISEKWADGLQSIWPHAREYLSRLLS